MNQPASANRKRLTFECWHCHHTYELTRDIRGNPRWIVECPYCSSEAVADLNNLPRNDAVTVLRGDSATPAGDDAPQSLILPPVIPTSPLPPQDAAVEE